MMLYSKRNMGIVADNLNRRVSIFDADTLQALQQIPIDADVIDVAVTRDCRRAVVSSFVDKKMFQLDLSGSSVTVIGSATADTFLEDVTLTPDGRYALSVDGAAANQDIVVYSLADNAFVSSLPANAQAVAVSPNGNGLVLTAVEDNKSVRRYTISSGGEIIDSDQEFPAGPGPVNIDFSPDGNFAFVSGYTYQNVSVLSTILPDNISLISTDEAFAAQSMAVSRDGKHLFVLGTNDVAIFAFDPIAGYLSFERSFAHGLKISSYLGVDQIALNASETRLFISGEGEVAAFTTYGVKLGSVADVSGPGGLAIYQASPCRRRCFALLGLLLIIALT